MSKSQIRTLMCVLCLAALSAVIAGCEEQAAKEPSPVEAEQPKMAPAKPKPKVAAPKVETTPKAETTDKGSTLGPYGFTANWMDEPGFITNWLVVGPFPNPGERPDNEGFNVDYLKNYGDELNHTPTNGMEIKKDDGTVVKWQQYESEYPEISFFDIESLGLEYDQEDILCYCACWLEADADKEVELRIGSDDGYKLWVNHKPISEQNVYRAMETDQETYKVKLNKGKNLVLLKVTQDWGEFEFMLRVVDAEGKEAPGIKVWN